MCSCALAEFVSHFTILSRGKEKHLSSAGILPVRLCSKQRSFFGSCLHFFFFHIAGEDLGKEEPERLFWSFLLVARDSMVVCSNYRFLSMSFRGMRIACLFIISLFSFLVSFIRRDKQGDNYTSLSWRLVVLVSDYTKYLRE